jgi:GNAT superfamily N-acetyltransferase
MIRRATLADLNQIIEMTTPYHYEAGVNAGRELSRERILQTFYGAIMNEDWITLVNDDLTAILIAYESHSFYDTPEMGIDFFYVSPETRASGVSRKLVEEIIKIARERKVAVLYCGCHSYMADGGTNDRLFSNLFKKYGFKETGMNLHLGL